MSEVNYDALRAQALGTGNDEAVTVNTRALMDKVLARYSGEWTTLRKLLQNAADASARKVTIRLETLPSRSVPAPQTTDSSAILRHVILNHTLKATVIENDGQPFKPTDWARLKKIAEGNPDETKIGAFGVGFYSVFADCEEPFVSSGSEALAFYWRGDALYTKRLQLPDAQTTKTTFVLPLRSTSSAVPNLLSLGQFLTNSLTFVGLQNVELWVDEWKILSLNKKVAPGVPIDIPKELGRKTAEGLLHVDSVVREGAQVDADWVKALEWKPSAKQDTNHDASSHGATGPVASQSLRSFFSRLAPSSSKSETLERQAKAERERQDRIAENLLEQAHATLFIHVNKASMRTTTTKAFAAELERATKKAPPRVASLALLSASYDEREASSEESGMRGKEFNIFESFVPQQGKGRIFIGFTTNQTTGLSIHVSTPSIIPTVEREAIDLNNRFVRQWNVEMLRAAGIVSRISWGQEMCDLDESLQRIVKTSSETSISKEHIKTLLPAATYVHDSFGWSETTPSSEVGYLMEEAFWTCNKKIAISTLSTKGVMPSSSVRREPEDGLGFVEDIPVIPLALSKTRLVQKLSDYGIIVEINVTDIKRELENKALNANQLRLFLTWLAQKLRINEFSEAEVRSLLNVAVANDESDGESALIVLAEAKNFLNISRIPSSMPVPPSTLPFNFTKKLAKQDLELLGFADLQMVPWLKWLLENHAKVKQVHRDHDPTFNAAFAGQVLATVSKQFDGLSQSSKSTVLELLTQRTVIPTKVGMKKPNDAYFANVKLFDDLPTIMPLSAVKDKFLTALGVRKTVDIGVVFDRLMNPSTSIDTKIPGSAAKWSHVDLIKYLVSVRTDIPKDDIKRLRSTKLCPAEGENSKPTSERFLLSELFEPDPELRELQLRTMHWPPQYRAQSEEAKFLTTLGLRNCPSYSELVTLMSESAANHNYTLRNRALKYFIDHFQTKAYSVIDPNSLAIPYLPIQGSEQRTARPSEIYVNEKATVLGFDVLRNDLHAHASKFGVKSDPPIAECTKRLISNPPNDSRTARGLFSYMNSRGGDLTREDKDALGNASIVPIPLKGSGMTTKDHEQPRKIKHLSPRRCYLGSGEQFADIFDFVDLGDQANAFLLTCGSKHEPSTAELAKRLVAEPATIYSLLGDVRYIEVLRTIASAWKVLRKDKVLAKEFQSAKCLLAYREVNSIPSEKDDPEQSDDESVAKLWQLASASRIVIIDDFTVYNSFRTHLLAAPQEDPLEALYDNLGATYVSSLLEITPRLGVRAQDQSPAGKLQKMILERTRLFLNDYTSDKVRHNFAWLQKHLKVECVQSMSVRWSLRGYNVAKKDSITAMTPGDKPALYITAPTYSIVDVSQALVPLLLYRSSPNAVYMLEMFLQSSLKQLRSRGYNVDRILRVKAAEARIAEEERQKSLAEEQETIKQREQDWQQQRGRQTTAEQQGRGSGGLPMPGVFPDSPEKTLEIQVAPGGDQDLAATKRGGLFSGLSKHFNLDTVRRNLTNTPAELPIRQGGQAEPSTVETEAPPPPYTAQRQIIQKPPPETVTAPHQIQQNLVNAIQASRGYNSNQLQSQPTMTEVKEAPSYCDSTSAQNIRFIGTMGSVRIFMSNDDIAQDPTAVDTFVSANTTALSQFANVLLECADIYHMRRDAIHIFYNTVGRTIAFNQSGALFFNYRYFENLHLPAVQQGKSGDAVVYWAVCMAHELAHNLADVHGAQHSYYTESLIGQYFGKIAQKATASPSGAINSEGVPARRLQEPLRPQPAT